MALVCLGAVSACASMTTDQPSQVRSLANDYLRDLDLRTVDELSQSQPVRKLAVREGHYGQEVSANLNEADLRLVLLELVGAAGLTLTLDDVALDQKVSAVFDDVPFEEAINLLLCVADASASITAEQIIVTAGSVSAKPTATQQVRMQVQPQHLPIEAALALLNPTGPVKADASSVGGVAGSGASNASSNPEIAQSAVAFPDPAPDLTITTLPGRNTLFLSGQLRLVNEAIRTINFGDRERPHVVIEAVIIEANSFALENLGMNIANIASGDLANGSLSPGSLLQSTITFNLLKGANTPSQLSAIIDLLRLEENAQIISRPFASTLSHEPASISITEERYVVVEDVGRTRSIRPLKAGVDLKITPQVMGDEVIRVGVEVEASDFISPPDAANVVLERSNASTLVDVQDGQTLVIGGLYRGAEARERSGVPGLMDLPGLDLLTSRRAKTQSQTEITIYVTPRIWRRNSPPEIMDERLIN